MMVAPTTIKWIVFYDDGSSFTSEEGEPWDAPRVGVEAIAIVDISCGVYAIGDLDFYCWHFEDNGYWMNHNERGMLQYLAKPGKEKVVLQGYAINRAKWANIKVNAVRDPRLPKVTAKAPREAAEE